VIALAQFPPSTYAIEDMLDGVPGALPRVAGLTALRALIIAPGVYIGSPRIPPAQLVKTSIAVSASVTVGMALWYWLKKGDAR
jgi:hypothetical protein